MMRVRPCRHAVRLLLVLSSAAPSGKAALAQGGTDILLAPLRGTGDALSIGDPVNLTRRVGYDNQPSFTPASDALLYTTIDDAGQADIRIIRNVESMPAGAGAGAGEWLIRTSPESEYSATVMPNGRIAVVRVEADSTQRLWSFTREGGEPRLVFDELQPVGYFAWADSTMAALFILGEPPTLQLADTRSGAARVVAAAIGRSLQKIPARRAISFIQHVPELGSWVVELDVATGALRRLVRTLDGAEDHTWTPDGTLLMGRGSRLFAWDPRAGSPLGDDATAWRELADLADAGVVGITRLAVSPDGRWLALVAEDQDSATRDD
ncbi:MAG: hypothetical protein ACRELD_10345 [Longimicrobiales bacterium]